MNLAAGGALHVYAGFENDGTLTINATGAPIGTYLRASETCAMTGGGEIVLNSSPADLNGAYLQTVGGATLTNGPAHTVHGLGRIHANFVNDGEVRADVADQTLELLSAPKTNNSLMQATNGATLLLGAISIGQSPAGRLVADDATLRLSGPTITGGRMEAINGGRIELTPGYSATLDAVELLGPVDVPPGSAIYFSGGDLTHEGTITVNTTAASTGTFLRFDQTGTLGGAGEIVLNANPADLNSAYLQNVGGVTLTHGPDRLLRGSGSLYGQHINQGWIAPGPGPSAIRNQGALICETTSVLDVEVGGTAPGQYDQIYNGTTALAGTLVVSLINGFTPASNDEFPIVTAGTLSGAFDEIVAPGPPSGLAWRVRYSSTSAVLTATCPPDLSGDHHVDLTDLSILLVHFGLSGAASADGDLDGDGDVDLLDLSTLLIAFGTSCT